MISLSNNERLGADLTSENGPARDEVRVLTINLVNLVLFSLNIYYLLTLYYI